MHAQLRPTLCDPMDCSLPDSSVHRILQARILEWVVIPFSRRFPALQADSLPPEPLGKPRGSPKAPENEAFYMPQLFYCCCFKFLFMAKKPTQNITFAILIIFKNTVQQY